MEINVTALLLNNVASDFSASVAERGNNVARETWNAANVQAADKPLVSGADDIQHVKDFFKGFGAWSRAEIAAWTDTEVNALLVQYISGDWRELTSLCPGEGLGDVDWDEAEELSEAGTIGGRIFVSGDQLFAYIGE